MKAEDSALDLKRQLDAYAAVAKSTERNPRSRWSRWPVYAAAAGAALAGASAASADIIYSGPLDLTGPSLNVAPNASHSIGFAVDVNIQRHFVSSTTVYGGHNPSANLVQEFGAASGYNKASIFWDPARFEFAKNFASGSPISGTYLLRRGAFLGTARSVLTEQGQVVSTGPGPRNNFPNGGFLGFEMFATNGEGGAVPGTGEFGWIHVQFDSTFRGSWEISGWAYNTDGGPIDAGEISATPEPGAMALMLLAAGAAGVLDWKRRHIRQTPNA